MTYIVKDIKAEAAKLADLQIFNEAPGVTRFENGKFRFSPGFEDEKDFQDYKSRHKPTLPKWIVISEDRAHLVLNAGRIKGIIQALNRQGLMGQIRQEITLIEKELL